MSPIDTINSEGSLHEISADIVPLFSEGSMITKRYKAVELIGRGGFGEVYRAFDLVLNREVAVKVLYKKQQTTDQVHQKNVSRFLNEARITAQLKHKSLPVTYDFGQLPEGEFYLVCELLKGESLSSRVRKSALSPHTALEMLRQVAGAVQVAHENGVLHRDLKPSNIFCVGDIGQRNIEYKVLDFGIAKEIDEQGMSGLISDHTQVNGIIGSPRYLAPERLKRELTYGPPSDIYSLGVVLFITLTQRFPYNGKSMIEIGLQHFTSPIPKLELEGLDPRYLKKLQALIDDLLAKEVNHRIQTAADVVRRAQILIDDLNTPVEKLEIHSKLESVMDDGTFQGNPARLLNKSIDESSVNISQTGVTKGSAAKLVTSTVDSASVDRLEPDHHNGESQQRSWAMICLGLLGLLLMAYAYFGLEDVQTSSDEMINRHTQRLELHQVRLATQDSKVSVLASPKEIETDAVRLKLDQAKYDDKKSQKNPKSFFQKQGQVKKNNTRVSESITKVAPKRKNKRGKEVSPMPSKIIPPQSVQLQVKPLKASYVIGERLKLNLMSNGGQGGRRSFKLIPAKSGRINGSYLRLNEAGKVIVKGCIAAVCDQKKLIVFEQPIDEF